MSVANASRTTHAAVANDTSSRSHAICQVRSLSHVDFRQERKLRYWKVGVS